MKIKDVLLKNKYLRHSINIIQSNDHRIETDGINKTEFSWFDDKIYIQHCGYDGLALGY